MITDYCAKNAGSNRTMMAITSIYIETSQHKAVIPVINMATTNITPQ